MNASSFFSQALQHHQAGRLAQAEALYRQLLAEEPRHAVAMHHLGVIAHQVGRHELAIDLIGRALQLRPALPEALHNLGNAQAALRRLEDAIASYHRALQLRPTFAEVWNSLGTALAGSNQFEEAAAAFGRAIELRPGYAAAFSNLGNALKEQGLLDDAITAFREAARLESGQPVFQSNVIYTLLFQPSSEAAILAAEQQAWNQRFAEPLRPFLQRHENDRDPERRLRIGYLSADFRDHVIGRNLLPLFKHCDRSNFEVICYSDVLHADAVTEEFRGVVHRWQNVIGLGNDACADLIRRDGVDVLVDLGQHMKGNRLAVFAWQPAPVQVSFAGYPESTGLETIGARISDQYLEAEIEPELRTPNSDPLSAEQVFLLDSFWCYDPCGAQAEVNALPALKEGFVTFGCLNNFCKINEPVLRLWAQVLRQVPDSRLTLLTPPGDHRLRLIALLEHEGIAGHRVTFSGPRPRQAYLQLYHSIDIALDAYPYHGHTTSLDALWMGVPIVSLVGTRAVSRAGLGQLSLLDLPELAAFRPEDYTRIAVELAGGLPRLAALRANLRSRMEASPLMDAPRFARGIEAACRAMWRRWCAANPVPAP